MTRYRVALNVVLTVVVVVVTLLPALSGHVRPWWAYPLAVAASVPVFWRERAPLRVGLVVGGATTGLALAGTPPLLPLGALVAVYTIAALGSLAARLVGVAGTALGVTLSLVPPGDDAELLRYLAVAYVAAFALGTGARARRVQVTALRERTQRLEQEQRAAVLRERTRIARDLHDILTHSVGIMVVQAEAGPILVRDDPDRADAAFAAIATTGRDAVVQLRRAVGALRESSDESFDPPGLAALPALVAQARAAGLDVALHRTGQDVDPPADVAVAVYRIVQEALTNVVRHARARSVRIALHGTADELTIEVADDGRGRRGETGGRGRPGEADGRGRPGETGGEAAGHGLVGMRERALACGGTLETGTSDAGGFVVRAVLPR
ncbi:sensor histidine kinase [Cryptosporangium sp. NPDC051539]|uniref:sensor histidine kinase n=1 Tax=Cryptosporangium sp. NPDC051539 TaxID=3363962 RepID=UPI00378A8709